MNSRLDWLVLSDYYSIYVTNAPPKRARALRRAGSFLVVLLFTVRTLSAVDRRNVRGTMISPTPMRTETDIRRNECAVELRKKNPDRYCDPDSGAGNQSRTDDLVITNDVLYQLSHASKIVVFSIDLTIISNFSPFVNPFLKFFLGGSGEDLGGGGEDLGGREPPLSERGLSPSKPPSLTENFPHDPASYEAKICFDFCGGGVMGEVFAWAGGDFQMVRLRARLAGGISALV